MISTYIDCINNKYRNYKYRNCFRIFSITETFFNAMLLTVCLEKIL